MPQLTSGALLDIWSQSDSQAERLPDPAPLVLFSAHPINVVWTPPHFVPRQCIEDSLERRCMAGSGATAPHIRLSYQFPCDEFVARAKIYVLHSNVESRSLPRAGPAGFTLPP